MSSNATSELKKELVEIVKSVKEGKEFVVDQAPDVVQHFIRLEIAYFFIATVFSIAMGFIMYKVIKRLIFVQNTYSGREGEKVMHVWSIFIALAVLIASLIAALSKLGALIAPKWHVVSYFL